MRRKQHFYLVTGIGKAAWFDGDGYLIGDQDQWVGNAWPYTLAEARKIGVGQFKIFKVGLPFNNFIKQVK